jgi:hypothetical protein
MSAIAKNTFKIQTTAIGSLPILSDQDVFQCLDQVDVPFYPEFPQLSGHMMLDYPVGSAHTERSKYFDLFCRYLSQKNSAICKIQWCGLMTFAQYRKNIDQYLDYFQTCLNWIDEIKSKIPSVKKIILFIDEPALSLITQSSISQEQWSRYREYLQSIHADIFVHSCGVLPVEWPSIYRQYGLSFDLNVVNLNDSYLDQFSKLALGIQLQNRVDIPSSILSRTHMVTPPCGLTSSSHSQVIDILSKLRQF